MVPQSSTVPLFAHIASVAFGLPTLPVPVFEFQMLQCEAVSSERILPSVLVLVQAVAFAGTWLPASSRLIGFCKVPDVRPAQFLATRVCSGPGRMYQPTKVVSMRVEALVSSSLSQAVHSATGSSDAATRQRASA